MTALKRIGTAAAATLIFATLLPAQGVQFKTRNKTEFGGAIGGAMKMAAKLGGGGTGEVEQVTFISGRKMRSDMDKSSSIIDLDARKVITVDHGKKQYSEATFEEMKAMLAQMQMQTAGEQDKNAKNAPTAETKVDVKVESTGEKQDINGMSAKRYLINATATVTPTPEQRKEGMQSVQIVVLNDMWMTKDGAYQATQDFNKAMAEEMGDVGKGALNMLLGMYPGAGEAIKKAGGEMRKLEGAAVRQTMYMATVPEGVKFDRDLLMASGEKKKEDEPKKKGGFGAMMKAAAAKAQGMEEEPSANKPPAQGLLFKSTTDIIDVQRTVVDGAIFSPPAGYKKVTPKN